MVWYSHLLQNFDLKKFKSNEHGRLIPSKPIPSKLMFPKGSISAVQGE